MTRVLIGLIRLYQRCISVWLPPVCRFYPSCSEYAAEAIRAHGVWVGGRLAARRLLSCHPFHPGGYDPVPLSSSTKADWTPGAGARHVLPKGQVRQ